MKPKLSTINANYNNLQVGKLYKFLARGALTSAYCYTASVNQSNLEHYKLHQKQYKEAKNTNMLGWFENLENDAACRSGNGKNPIKLKDGDSFVLLGYGEFHENKTIGVPDVYIRMLVSGNQDGYVSTEYVYSCGYKIELVK